MYYALLNYFYNNLLPFLGRIQGENVKNGYFCTPILNEIS